MLNLRSIAQALNGLEYLSSRGSVPNMRLQERQTDTIEMKIKDKNIWLPIAGCMMALGMIISGCMPSAKEENQLSGSEPDTPVTKSISMADSVHLSSAKPMALQPVPIQENLPPADTQSSPSGRTFNEVDKAYIDLIIPDYPDVIVLHESSAETLNYTEQVYQYLILKKGSVRKEAITQKHLQKARDKRLYIADVGENWYEVYVFDKWK